MLKPNILLIQSKQFVALSITDMWCQVPGKQWQKEWTAWLAFETKFSIGEIVRHKHFDFRGVIYDVDFQFNNSEEWYRSIPKNVRPRKNQPFYHLLAENDEITYEAYVSEQNLIIDDSNEPIKHPLLNEIFSGKKGSGYFKPSN